MKKRIINKMEFFACDNCNYLKKINKLSKAEEKKRYDLHVCDEGYHSYMNNIYMKIKPYLNNGVSLDYGCGQIHLLSDILNSNGISCDYYDLYYYPSLNNVKYDNIILIEVFEHVDDLFSFLLGLKKILKPNGKIIIMSKLIPDDITNWWYMRDETHISFFDEKTLAVLSELLEFKLNIYDGSIFVFKS